MGIEAFISRWANLTEGAQRSNYVMFLCELCEALDLPRPEPASARRETSDYVFERMVRPHDSETGLGPMRIDLYRRDAFVLEAKQSRWPSRPKAGPQGGDPADGRSRAPPELGRRATGAGWDALMSGARRQAEAYVAHLPPDHRAPPFILICDVAHVIEVYADFSGTGRNYTHFPDRHGFRIYLQDLHDPAQQERLRRIWTAPWALDPSLRRAEASREIAAELAHVSRHLEADGSAPKAVAQFLMRCVFTMYACNVGLLPQDGFTRLLVEGRKGDVIAQMMGELWRRLHDPDPAARFFSGFGVHVRHFGGRLFQQADVLRLGSDGVEALIRASRCDWSQVEPAIFGAFLEQALDKDERRRRGVHYTPRRYVERLVQATLISPLRERWEAALAGVAHALSQARPREARERIAAFHAELCALRVLDPACGTGNFLYVAMEMLKRLEGEVLEALAQLGGTEPIGLETIDPGVFIGLELDPRAAVIAELVLMLGYLQLHYRTAGGHPAEPILRDFGCVREMDAILDRGPPDFRPATAPSQDRIESYPSARRPQWPRADYIIGNPPFLGGKDLRRRLGDAYAEALWAAHPQMNPAADLAAYWWDHAAELLTQPGTALRRFGFITSNSITQTHQRRGVARRLAGPPPIHLTFAIPDHPWTLQGRDAAAVRVAMTVAEAGRGEGERWDLAGECDAREKSEEPTFSVTRGVINADLSIGVDLTQVETLLANRGLCSPGVKLHGAGFIVTPQQAVALGLGRRAGLEDYIRPYRNGRDLMQRSRGVMVIDLYPLAAETVRARFPEVYQHLLATVKPHRDANRMAFRRQHWWWFGATHETYRSFTAGLRRYIATAETAKHRVFVFLEAGVRADNMVVAVGSDDAFHLGVLSSQAHTAWAKAVGGVLEDRARYTKTACFDPFPFPDAAPAAREEIAALAERLEAIRRSTLVETPGLTLTGLYNALDAWRADRVIDTQARPAILDEAHRRLDAAVAAAYGWPLDITDDVIVARLATLNRRRRERERAGEVLWLRSDGQPSRATADIGGPRETPRTTLPQSASPGCQPRPLFPRARLEQPLAVLTVLREAGRPLVPQEVAARFRRARRAEAPIASALRTLSLYGYITALPDGRFLARRAA